jgi:hypothetical protein
MSFLTKKANKALNVPKASEAFNSEEEITLMKRVVEHLRSLPEGQKSATLSINGVETRIIRHENASGGMGGWREEGSVSAINAFIGRKSVVLGNMFLKDCVIDQESIVAHTGIGAGHVSNGRIFGTVLIGTINVYGSTIADSEAVGNMTITGKNTLVDRSSLSKEVSVEESTITKAKLLNTEVVSSTLDGDKLDGKRVLCGRIMRKDAL